MNQQNNSKSAGNDVSEIFDYIIVGAGIGGTVVALRLHEQDPSLSILLVEAEPDSSKTSLTEATASPMKVALLRGSELDWNYVSEPQRHLDGACLYIGGGKTLGGGSVINYVNDKRWSWEGFLPYFCKTETHHDPTVSSKHHGNHGPISTASVTSSERNYLLREPLRKAWKTLGIEQTADINDGSPLGLAEVVEARTKGKRVIASAAYPLDGINVLTSTLVRRVVITATANGEKTATGIQLANGKHFLAKREVILAAGSLRTPQLLLLSGIGPTDELKKHGIKQHVNSPNVGKNLIDHLCLRQNWKLRHPEIGASAGSAQWTDLKFQNGNAMDWHTSLSVPTLGLKTALSQDQNSGQEADFLLSGSRCHVRILVYYIGIPLDGTSITSFTLNYLPTSRGTITLLSDHPEDPPDRCWEVFKMFNTSSGKEMVTEEVVLEGSHAIHENSTDEDIDEILFKRAYSIQHPMGTASMGKVVDTDLRVIGVKCLRIVDASVIPTPISSPIQACVYALAEQAVDIILADS